MNRLFIPSLKLLLHSLFYLKRIHSYWSFSRITYRRHCSSVLCTEEEQDWTFPPGWKGVKSEDLRRTSSAQRIQLAKSRISNITNILFYSIFNLFQFYGYRSNGYLLLFHLLRRPNCNHLKNALKSCLILQKWPPNLCLTLIWNFLQRFLPKSFQEVALYPNSTLFIYLTLGTKFASLLNSVKGHLNK